MKQEDINRLKEICEKEGFEVRTRIINKDVFEITKKGPWDKVNFVKVIDTTGMLNVTLNKIYKVIDYSFGEIRFYDDKNNLEARNVIHGNFAGATKLPERVKVSFCWYKDEKHDRIYFNFHKNTGCEHEIGPSLFMDDNPSNIKAIGDFLSKQLENYLNDNQE